MQLATIVTSMGTFCCSGSTATSTRRWSISRRARRSAPSVVPRTVSPQPRGDRQAPRRSPRDHRDDLRGRRRHRGDARHGASPTWWTWWTISRLAAGSAPASSTSWGEQSGRERLTGARPSSGWTQPGWAASARR